MKTLYMVVSTTSDFESCFDVPVCVYEDENMANEHAKSANEWYKDIENKIKNKEINYGTKISSPYDPELIFAISGGCDYSVQTIQLRDSLPENKEN